MDSGSRVYIVIPHYQKWELTHARLWELYKYCRQEIAEVIVVNNGSQDNATLGGLKWWAEWEEGRKFKVTSISIESNIGFLLASNFGIYKACSMATDSDIVILLSNDVEIRTNFIRQILETLNQSPITLMGGVLYSHDTGWNKFGDKVFPYLEGWLLATTKMGWSASGWGFDTRFAPSDYEDVDLSTFFGQIGYALTPLNNPGLHHMGGQTIGYTPERLERTKINKKKFEEKWIGGIPN